jgi:hypothetical protein
MLRAHYSRSSDDTSNPADVVATGVFRTDVVATNTGEAVWLASGKHDRGVVTLGWRWYRDGRELMELSGRKRIPYDIFPGQSYVFRMTTDPPSRPGVYMLEIGLVSEHVTWFSDVDSAPIRLVVEVQAGDLRMLANEPEAAASPVKVGALTALSIQRAGDVHRMSVTWGMVGAVDVYLSLQARDGSLWFHNGRGLVPRRSGWWIPFATGLNIQTTPQRTGAVSTFSLAGLPPTEYIYEFVVTEPDSYRTIAAFRGSFDATK